MDVSDMSRKPPPEENSNEMVHNGRMHFDTQCLSVSCVFEKTRSPFSLFQATCNTIEQSRMNLLCLVGLLAGVWLFNQAVTWEELLLDTPAESRDFIDSHTGLPFYLWLSGFRESKKVTLLHWKQQQAVQPRLKPSVSLEERWRDFPKYHLSSPSPPPPGLSIAYAEYMAHPLCQMAPPGVN